MEKEEKKLAQLFQQLGNNRQAAVPPDTKLKDAVFSTLDATSLIADILDLFTVKFVQAQADIVSAVPHGDYGSERQEKQRVFSYLEQKYKDKSLFEDDTAASDTTTSGL